MEKQGWTLVPSRAVWWQLGLVLLVAIGLDFLFYTGFYAADDIGYFNGAGWLSGQPGDGILRLSGDIRLGVTVPSGFIYWLSGGNVGWMSWAQLPYHLALVCIAFCYGKLVRSELTGLIAAFLVASCPLFYVFAGALYPDNPTAMWVGLAMLTLEWMRRQPDMPTRLCLRWCFAIGVLIGIGYTCNEKSLVLTIPVAISVMAAAPSLKSFDWIRMGLVIIAGLLLVMGIEVLVLRILTGQWIWRLGILQGFGDLYEKKMAAQGTTPLERFRFATRVRLKPHVPISMWILPMASLAYAFTRKRVLALLLFFWFPLIFITIGSTSLSAYHPPTLQTRYYSLVVLPAAIMTAIMAAMLLDKWQAYSRLASWARGRFARGLGLATLLLLVACYEFSGNVPFSGNMYKAGVVRGFVAAVEEARTRYPQYPVVLSRHYTERMSVLLAHAPASKGYAPTYRSGEPLPEPPYLYLQAMEMLSSSEEGSFVDASGRTLYKTTLEIVEPAPNRVEAIVNSITGIFEIRPREPLATPARGNALIQLVSAERPDAKTGERVPLEVFGKENVADVKVRLAPDGYFVLWNHPKLVAVQAPDNRSYKRAPSHPGVSLPADTRQLRLELDLALSRGAEASVSLTLYGYTAAGTYEKSNSSVTLQPGAAAKPVAVELTSSTELVSYKMRLSLKQEGESTGVLQLSNPRLVTHVEAPSLLQVFGQENKDKVAVHEEDDGFLVEWQDPPLVALQLPDDRSYKNPPVDDRFILSVPTKSLSLTTALRLEDGPPATAKLTFYGYTEEGELVRSTESFELSADAGEVPVSMHLDSEKELRAYKFRISLDQAAEKHGSLHLRAPQLLESP